MATSIYDSAAEFYCDFVKRELENPLSLMNQTVGAIMDLLGDIEGKRICDLACGEGHLSRALAERGAIVTGVDLSHRLLEQARQQTVRGNIDYVLDDAQALNCLGGAVFDIVICNMALMDISDLDGTFRSVWRILGAGGTFLFSILHPCFETPFRSPDDPIEVDANGDFAGCRVRRYAEEGHWCSGGTGVRGTFGAYHRMLSTYINRLISAGFDLRHLVEPMLPAGNYSEMQLQWSSKIPRTLIVECVKCPPS